MRAGLFKRIKGSHHIFGKNSHVELPPNIFKDFDVAAVEAWVNVSPDAGTPGRALKSSATSA